MYKINYHAHTMYSDGVNTLEEMAIKAKEIGLCCFVATDHYYKSADDKLGYNYSLNKESWLRQVREAKELEQKLSFPIIIGVEATFARCEEINVFGFDAINFLFDAPDNSVNTFLEMRENFDCACILNHPGLYDGKNGFHRIGGERVIDGFERYNSGRDFFDPEKGRVIPDFLKSKPYFSNSDAHSVNSLGVGYNLIPDLVITEGHLIKSIKVGPYDTVIDPESFVKSLR